MKQLQLNPIGTIQTSGGDIWVELDPQYGSALQAIEGFDHLNILWWFSDFDTPEARSVLEVPQPYKHAPAVVGIFATRSPIRPNPIALTAVQVLRIDHERARIYIPYIDAHPGTPVLDIKPYTPSADRVESPGVPVWCRHWPRSLESSEGFAWEEEFNF